MVEAVERTPELACTAFDLDRPGHARVERSVDAPPAPVEWQPAVLDRYRSVADRDARYGPFEARSVELADVGRATQRHFVGARAKYQASAGQSAEGRGMLGSRRALGVGVGGVEAGRLAPRDLGHARQELVDRSQLRVAERSELVGLAGADRVEQLLDCGHLLRHDLDDDPPPVGGGARRRRARVDQRLERLDVALAQPEANGQALAEHRALEADPSKLSED